MTMPGLAQRSPHLHNSPSGSIVDCQGGFVPSHHKDGVDPPQLQRFWKELSSSARRDLLRIDKHGLFEQVRKNLYCSRCNGLLLEAFSQIVAYSKSHQGGSLCHGKHAAGCNKTHCDRKGDMSNAQDDARDPSVHPWGGLTATRDSMLTLLDCFLDGQPLEVIQNVCDCARARDRERELLYPDACGGGGRGWISQGIGNSGSGRGHSLKETCALHTARLSCDALVDFWSALGEETRRSLLRMKEEDFIARLMFRFESKRFCRDCRRNVLKELKELKELKRSRKEPKCTKWFCNADTAFRYEVSNTSVHVNWRECFGGDFGSTYQHFEWGLGSAEGNSDILGFEDVGLSEGARVDGLDLSQISLFYITLRAWKHDGRCTEVSVKAHGLKGKQCVHRRLLVGDGHVTITKGESIKRFFEHAEEAEEEEDEDGMDKSGSEPESEGFRVQKHAKSPELAREFLLDAATIIFKEQVEKAFREGTARQNAHTIFVCLALNLLEERIHVACKEISTLEKQKQLLEEEEHEKREEEQRRERRRLKEKEKKLRRREKQKGRDREKEKFKCDLQPIGNTATDCDSGATSLLDENEEVHTDDEGKESVRIVDDGMLNDEFEALQSLPLESMEVQPSADCSHLRSEALDQFDLFVSMDSMEDATTQDCNGSFFEERSKSTRRRSRPRKGPFMEVISRRFIRRSSVTALDSPAGSRGRVKLSCTTVREMSEVVSEQVFLGTQKLHRGATKTADRNTGSSSIEGWNNMRYQQRQNGLVSQSSSKRSFYVKSKQNETSSWVGKECFSIKSFQRKNSVVLGSKKVSQMGSFVSGSSQCNWQIIKAIPGGGTKRGSPDQDLLVDSEIVSSNSSSESEKTLESDFKECLSVVSDESAEPLIGSDHQDACDCGSSGSSSACFAGEEQQNDLSTSVGGCVPETSVFSSMNSSAGVEPLSNGKPLCRLVAISTGESLDDDGSPSSAASCVTDTSDGGLTSCSMTTESSNAESSSPSVDASTVELSPSVSIGHQDSIKEAAVQCSTSNENVLRYDNPAIKLDNHQAFSAVERVPCQEFYPYSSAPSLLAYAHEYSCGYEHMQLSVNPEISVLDVTSHICQTDSSMQLPLLPPSLLPMHVPQSFGFPWIPGQCVTAAPVLSTGLLPLPHHSGSVYVDGFGPSTGGLTSPLLPLPPPFQPVPPVMGFACLPAPAVRPSFTHWRDERLVFNDGQKAETSPLMNGFEENGFSHQCAAEEFLGFSDSPDSAPASNAPSNDPLGFSLFHFGSLSTDEQELSVVGPSQECANEALRPLDIPCGRAVQQEAVGIPKSNSPVEEYSLFAATPSSRFRFF
eukprot:c16576_g1_i1 orf=170-4153(-)